MGDWVFDPNQFKRFAARISALSDEVAQEAVEAFVDAAVPVMVKAFEDASTPTGDARVAKGGNGPGRIDTGLMVGNLKGAVTREARTFIGEAGWLDKGPQQPYFLLQDQGFLNVVGAHGLEQGFQAGREAARIVIESRWSNR